MLTIIKYPEKKNIKSEIKMLSEMKEENDVIQKIREMIKYMQSLNKKNMGILKGDKYIPMLMEALKRISSHKEHYKYYVKILNELMRLFPNIKPSVINNDYMLTLVFDNLPTFQTFKDKINFYNKLTNNFDNLNFFTLDKLLRANYFLFKEILLDKGNNDLIVMNTIKNFVIVFQIINAKVNKIINNKRDNTQILLDLQTVKDGLMEAIIMRSIKCIYSETISSDDFDNYVSTFEAIVKNYYLYATTEICEFNKNVSKEILILQCYYLSLLHNQNDNNILSEVMQFVINLITESFKNWKGVITSVFTDLNKVFTKDTFFFATKEIDKFLSIYSHYDNYSGYEKKNEYNFLNSIKNAYDVHRPSNTFKGLMLLIAEMIKMRTTEEDKSVVTNSISCSYYMKPSHNESTKIRIIDFNNGLSPFTILTIIYNITIYSHYLKLKPNCLFDHEILMITANCVNCKDVFFYMWDYHLILKIIQYTFMSKKTQLVKDDIENVSIILTRIYYEINEYYIHDVFFVSTLTSILNEYISTKHPLNQQIIKLKLYLTFFFPDKDFAYDVDFCIKYFIIDRNNIDHEMLLLVIRYLIHCFELGNEFKCKVIEDLMLKYYTDIINAIYQIEQTSKTYDCITKIIFDIVKDIKDEKKFEQFILKIENFNFKGSKNNYKVYQIKIFLLFLVYFNDTAEAKKMRIIINVLFPNNPNFEFHTLHTKLLTYFHILDSKFVMFTGKKGKEMKQSNFPCLIAKTNEKEKLDFSEDFVVIDYNKIIKGLIFQRKRKEDKYMMKILNRSIKQVYPFNADTLKDAIDYYTKSSNKSDTAMNFLVNCVYLLNFKSDLYLNENSSQTNESIISVNNCIKDELLDKLNIFSTPLLFCFYMNSVYDEEMINGNKNIFKEDSKIENKINELLAEKKKIITEKRGSITNKEKYEIIFTIFNLREIIALCSIKTIIDALFLCECIAIDDWMTFNFSFKLEDPTQKKKVKKKDKLLDESASDCPKMRTQTQDIHKIKSPFFENFADILGCYFFEAYTSKFPLQQKEMDSLYKLYQNLDVLYSKNQEDRKSLLHELYYYIFILRASNRTNIDKLPNINEDYVRQSSIYKREDEIILIHHINETEGELILTTPISLYYYHVYNKDKFAFNREKQFKELKHLLDKERPEANEDDENKIKEDNDYINSLSDGTILQLFETYEGMSKLLLWRKAKFDDDMISHFISLIQMPINITYTINIAYSSSIDGNIDNLFANIKQHIPNHYINFISHLGKVNENKQIIYKDNFYTLIFNIVNISNANENVSDVLLSSSKVIYLLDTHLLVKNQIATLQREKDYLLHFVSRVSDSHYLIQRRTSTKDDINLHYASDYLININAKSSIRYFIKSIIAYSEWFFYNSPFASKNDLYMRKEKFDLVCPKKKEDDEIFSLG